MKEGILSIKNHLPGNNIPEGSARICCGNRKIQNSLRRKKSMLFILFFPAYTDFLTKQNRKLPQEIKGCGKASFPVFSGSSRYMRLNGHKKSFEYIFPHQWRLLLPFPQQ